jgi:hypothetical protein
MMGFSVLIMAALVISLDHPGEAAQAPSRRTIALARPVPASPIVGRATCDLKVWLLNRAAQLVEIQPKTGHSVIHPVRGLRSGARPWALACVTGGELWTLETPHLLTRLGPDGHVEDRVALRWPRTALFAAGDQVVYHQLPTVSGAPLLISGVPRMPSAVRAWAGLLGRAAPSQKELFARNLVSCGIGAGAFLPCWFVNEARITISDGTTTREVSIPALASATVDRAIPVWDAALLGSGAVWVLASSVAVTSHTGRVGRRLLLVDRAGVERVHIELSPPARLIVAATDTSCTLLTTTGDLMDITLKTPE